MAPVWNPNEASASLYDEVVLHSAGMISFSYHAPVPPESNGGEGVRTTGGALPNGAQAAPAENTPPPDADLKP